MNLTKIKGTPVDLPVMAETVSSMPEVEEWQVVLKKVNDDPHELDEFVLRVSLRSGTEREAFLKKVREDLLSATEVAPNRIDVVTTKELVEMLGMETEVKEKRFLDLRPK
jgi:hypothetical protein